MAHEFRIVASRFGVVEFLSQAQSEVLLLVAWLKLAVSGRGGTPGYLIENVCHGVLLMIKMPVQNSVCCSGAASRSSPARISFRSPSQTAGNKNPTGTRRIIPRRRALTSDGVCSPRS